ncbi:MAG TPA: hypothetical protein VF817_01995 [Patescibacteria group bacterium]
MKNKKNRLKMASTKRRESARLDNAEKEDETRSGSIAGQMATNKFVQGQDWLHNQVNKGLEKAGKGNPAQDSPETKAILSRLKPKPHPELAYDEPGLYPDKSQIFSR